MIEQYQQVERDYLGRVAELSEVTDARDKIRAGAAAWAALLRCRAHGGGAAAYDDLRKKRLEDFMAGFTQITQKLKEMYQVRTIALAGAPRPCSRCSPRTR